MDLSTRVMKRRVLLSDKSLRRVSIRPQILFSHIMIYCLNDISESLKTCHTVRNCVLFSLLYINFRSLQISILQLELNFDTHTHNTSIHFIAMQVRWRLIFITKNNILFWRFILFLQLKKYIYQYNLYTSHAASYVTVLIIIFFFSYINFYSSGLHSPTFVRRVVELRRNVIEESLFSLSPA